jgi:hypothetical protein
MPLIEKPMLLTAVYCTVQGKATFLYQQLGNCRKLEFFK